MVGSYHRGAAGARPLSEPGFQTANIKKTTDLKLLINSPDPALLAGNDKAFEYTDLLQPASRAPGNTLGLARLTPVHLRHIISAYQIL